MKKRQPVKVKNTFHIKCKSKKPFLLIFNIFTYVFLILYYSEPAHIYKLSKGTKKRGAVWPQNLSSALGKRTVLTTFKNLS